jgi:hypothetical protein
MTKLKFKKIDIATNGDDYFTVITKQIKEIEKEAREVRQAYLNSKYSTASIDCMVDKLFEVMQSSFTLINFLSLDDLDVAASNQVLIAKLVKGMV